MPNIVDRTRNQAIPDHQDRAVDGSHVGVLHDGCQPIARVADDPPDVLSLAIRLPGMHGIETPHHIRAEHAGLPIILNTKYSHLAEYSLTSWPTPGWSSPRFRPNPRTGSGTCGCPTQQSGASELPRVDAGALHMNPQEGPRSAAGIGGDEHVRSRVLRSD